MTSQNKATEVERKIWELATPYLEKGQRKDFILHTQGVLKASKLLLKDIEGDSNILLPGAILHDTGWALVPEKLQMSKKQADKEEGMKLHLKHGSQIAGKILEQLNFDTDDVERIQKLITSHKFCEPTDTEEKLLIDADNLSDIFKDQFYSDVKAYEISDPKELLNYRKNNEFYFDEAKEIFGKELLQRTKELGV